MEPQACAPDLLRLEAQHAQLVGVAGLSVPIKYPPTKVGGYFIF